MANDSIALVTTALFIGFVHTILGPDHYLPFVAMSKARNWSIRNTLAITAVCGAGHVAASVLLGLAGLALGTLFMQVESIQKIRADMAAWLLIGFGLTYFVWGLRRAMQGVSHTHYHLHPDGTLHAHRHVHRDEHLHFHDDPVKSQSKLVSITLFAVFILGPCEALIPLLIYPAAAVPTFGQQLLSIMVIVAAFGLATIATMILCVASVLFGIRRFEFACVERFSDALAGLAILMCGLLMSTGF